MCQITTLLHEYPKKHGLSIEWIADTMGISCSTLQRYLNPFDPRPFPLRLLLPFMRACNNDYAVLDLLESRIGRSAYPVACEGLDISCAEVTKFAKESGKALCTLAGAIEDGVIDEDEKRNCTRELLELQAIVNGLLGRLNQ
ncbi:MAG TPA: hypothetical protein DHV36_22185 [Desulfobacteraceae bacterium]|nr:hypothetical protein [Desulfobacteraceae bacterium]